MRPLAAKHRDRTIARIANSQWGVVSRRQLLAEGLSSEAISRALQAKRLHRVLPGIYAVGHVRLRRVGWWQAALLYCGGEAVLSHRTAAVVWGILPGDGLRPVDVISRGGTGREQPGIHVRRMALNGAEKAERFGLRVTNPARTLVDLAGVSHGRELRELVERAQDARRFDRIGIERIVAASPRRPGARSLAAIATLLGPDRDGARSELERRFLCLCRSERLPLPKVNEVIEGRRRDFVWPDQRLIVETDGYRWHSSRKAMRRDRSRDRELMIAGWRPARFTYEDVVFEPAEVAVELRALLISR